MPVDPNTLHTTMKDSTMGAFDYEGLKAWIDFAQFVGMVVLGIVGWQLRKDKSQDGRLDTLETLFADKVAEHEARLAVIDERLKHVPSNSETAALTQRIDALNHNIAGLQRALELQNQYLLTLNKP